MIYYRNFYQDIKCPEVGSYLGLADYATRAGAELGSEVSEARGVKTLYRLRITLKRPA